MDNVTPLLDRVSEFLVEMGLPPEGPENGPFFFRFGSTVVTVSLFTHGDDAYVRIASVLLRDFRPSLELITRILRLNTEVLFGAFLLFEDDTLAFAVTLPGVELTLSQFRGALAYVGSVSDEYDDELMAIAGGRRAMDLVGSEE